MELAPWYPALHIREPMTHQGPHSRVHILSRFALLPPIHCRNAFSSPALWLTNGKGGRQGRNWLLSKGRI